jgi:hypothetical protein
MQPGGRPLIERDFGVPDALDTDASNACPTGLELEILLPMCQSYVMDLGIC